MPVTPEVQALNDAQDRRIEEQARVSDQNRQERKRFEADLERRCSDSMEMLRVDIFDLQTALDNSGPVRRAWVKYSNQIPKNAEEDLQRLKSGLANQERQRQAERDAFEAGMLKKAR